MTQYPEKPKNTPPPPDDMDEVYSEFYRRLFVALTIPALILGLIFALPGLLFSLFAPSSPHLATCTTLSGNQGIKIVNQRWETHLTTFYWTNNAGDTWHILDTVEADYQLARANCDQVIFDANLIVVYHQNVLIAVDHTGRFDRLGLSSCNTIERVRRDTTVQEPEIIFNVTCDGDRDLAVRWSMAELR